MIDNTKYKKILEIYDEFPFLDRTIEQNGIGSVFKLHDLINPDMFDNYTRDIYKILSPGVFANTFSISLDEKIKNVWTKMKTLNPKQYFLFHLYYNIIYTSSFHSAIRKISDKESWRDLKNFYLAILNLYDDLEITPDTYLLTSEYYQLNQSKYSFIENIILNYTIYFQLLIPFMYALIDKRPSIYGKNILKEFFKQFDSNELARINNVYKNLIEAQKSFAKQSIVSFEFQHQYEDSKEVFKYFINKLPNYQVTSIQTQLNEEIRNMYNTDSTDHISEYCNNICQNLNYLFNYYDVEYFREVSVLNDQLSEEEKTKLLSSFKSANSIKTLIQELYQNNSINYNQLDFILESCILNNNKIKDRKFPKTKNKVMSDAIRNIFITSHDGKDIYNKITNTDMEKLIKKYTDYFYDPYFIQSIYNMASVYDNRSISLVSNTKSFLRLLFKNTELLKEVKDYIKKYISIIQTPIDQRTEATNNKISEKEICYGSLLYFIYNFIDNDKFTDNESKFQELIFNNIILDDKCTLNKTEILLFYISSTKCEELGLKDIKPYISGIGTELFGRYFDDTVLTNLGPFRLNIFLSYFDSGAFFNQSYNNFDNIYVQEICGSINNLLASINYSDKYNDKYLKEYAYSVLNHRSNYYYDIHYQLSDENFVMRQNAEKFVLLRYIEEAEKILVKNNREDIFNNFINDIKKIINTNDSKDVILTAASSLGQKIIKDSDSYRSKVNHFQYDNSIDFDTMLKYFDFKELNDKYQLFNIIDNFENMIFIPQLCSLTYAFEKATRYHSYSYSSAAFIDKYSENTTTRELLTQIQNLNEKQVLYLYDKFFKPYAFEDFNYNEYFNNTLINIVDFIYDSSNSTSRNSSANKNNLKYSMFSLENDIRSSLINGSVMETIIASYNDFFEQMNYENLVDENELNNIKDKLNQTAINYECLRSIIN